METYGDGPAFPSWDMPEHLEGAVRRGMSLREWYVGMALQGYIASFAGVHSLPPPDRIAQMAISCADAALTELCKEPA